MPTLIIAQTSGIANYSISYGYCDLVDNMATLQFDDNKSFFESTAGPNNTFSLVLHDTLTETPIQMTNSMRNHSQVFTNLTKGELITSNHLFLSEAHFTLEKPKTIEWEIQRESKNIKGYLCQKATGHFRGRDYEVWYTNEIPVEFGPWKFNGLPGLIVEVRERDNHVHIKLNSFNNSFNQEIEPIVVDQYYTVSEYFSIFKDKVLDLTPDHPARDRPNVVTFIDISKFTELE